LRAVDLILASMTLAACARETVVVLAVPGAARTIWISMFHNGEWIDEVSDATPTLRLPWVSADRVVISFFAETLVDLELDPGPVLPATEGACRTRRAPRAVEVHDTTGGALQRIDQDLLDLRAFRYEVSCPCRMRSIRSVPLLQRGAVLRIVPAGPKRAFILVEDPAAPGRPRVLSYDHDSGHVVEVARGPFDGAACATADGRLYLSAIMGGVFTYDDAEGLRAGPARSSTAPSKAMVCSSSAAFALNAQGAVHRFDGDAWTLLYDQPVPIGGSLNKGRLALLASSLLVFVQDDGDELIYLRGAEVLQRTAWGSTAAFDPSIGPVQDITGRNGEVYMVTRANNLLVGGVADDQWKTVSAAPTGRAASFNRILSIGDGLLMPSESSSIWELSPSLGGYCPPRSPDTRIDLREIARLDEHTVLAGGAESSDAPNVLVVIAIE